MPEKWHYFPNLLKGPPLTIQSPLFNRHPVVITSEGLESTGMSSQDATLEVREQVLTERSQDNRGSRRNGDEHQKGVYR